MQRLLFYDAYAVDTEIIGGSSQALKNLIKSLSLSDKFEINLLLNTPGVQAEIYKNSGGQIHTPWILKFAAVFGHSEKFKLRAFRFFLLYPLINIWFIIFCIRIKFDVIIFNESRGLITFLPSAMLFRKRVIAYCRGTEDFKKKTLLFSYRFTRKLICISTGVRNGLPERYLPKAEVIYDMFYKKYENTVLKEESEQINLISIGSIVPNKGFDISIKAICLLDSINRKGLNYKIIGPVLNNTFFSELIDIVRSNNLSEVIKFTGFQKDVYSYLMDADVLIIPSLNEGLGLVILEAFDASVPAIGSRTGGIPELIDDGINGFLFEPGDFKALSEILTKILLTPEVLITMRSNARKKLIKFLNNNSAEAFSNLMNEISCR